MPPNRRGHPRRLARRAPPAQGRTAKNAAAAHKRRCPSPTPRGRSPRAGGRVQGGCPQPDSHKWGAYSRRQQQPCTTRGCDPWDARHASRATEVGLRRKDRMFGCSPDSQVDDGQGLCKTCPAIGGRADPARGEMHLAGPGSDKSGAARAVLPTPPRAGAPLCCARRPRPDLRGIERTRRIPCKESSTAFVLQGKRAVEN